MEPHRDHFILLALLRQIPDAVDKELVGADICFPRFNHPTAQLHQLWTEDTVTHTHSRL